MNFVLTRTPYRVSFMGGGSDLAAYYRNEGEGMVVGATINRYVHISVNDKFDDRYRMCYSITEDVADVRELQHTRARVCIGLMGNGRPIEVHSCGDIPSGTGLGSSSAFTVGLLLALRSRLGYAPSDKRVLAELACEVEINHLREPIGKQDQYLCAQGGLSLFKFRVEGVSCDPMYQERLRNAQAHDSIMLLHIGESRSASEILAEQSKHLYASHSARMAVSQMVEMVPDFYRLLIAGQYKACGMMLDEAWQIKKRLAKGITNMAIDETYRKALDAGAWGGKLCGAGGSGFLMLFASPHCQAAIVEATGLKPLRYHFETQGAHVAYIEGGR